MSAADEIELKFLANPRDLDAVLAAAPSGDEHEAELVSTYFDTPQDDLRKIGVSLRIRESDGRRIQTLKRGDGFAREEHEVEVPGAELDLSLKALHECLAPEKHASLAPVFTVRVKRRQRTFVHQQAEIELAVDEGQVIAGGRAKPICEVELELKSGPCSGLFDLARSLSHTAPLYLSFEGKASQGRQLREGSENAARRYAGVRLKRKMTTAEAFQAIARAGLSQIAANAQLLRDGGGSEPLKQLRVALRRLRSAFSTFSTAIADPRAEELRAELKWLGQTCNEARDLDVFANDNAEFAQRRAVGGGRAAGALGAARKRAHAKAEAAVASRRFRDLVLELTAWIETGDWLSEPATREVREAPAVRFAEAALERRRKRLVKQGRALSELDDEGRHRVRITAKKLRYAADAFAPLFGADRTQKFVRRIKRLQDELGALNDAAVAQTLAARLAPEAVAGLADAHEAEAPERLRAAARAMKKLKDAPRFWR